MGEHEFRVEYVEAAMPSADFYSQRDARSRKRNRDPNKRRRKFPTYKQMLDPMSFFVVEAAEFPPPKRESMRKDKWRYQCRWRHCRSWKKYRKTQWR